MSSLDIPSSFYNSVKSLILQSRTTVYRSVNAVMLNSYWEIGRMIVEEEQKGRDRAEYGKYLIKNLSVELKKEFGKGFDESNLRNIRLFYLTFSIRDALRHELTWTHYRLLTRLNNSKAKEFYIEETISGNWSTRTLERNINSFYYERLLSSKIETKLSMKKQRKQKLLIIKTF